MHSPDRIYEAIRIERKDQDGRWGESNHTLPLWFGILTKQVGKASQHMLNLLFLDTDPAYPRYYADSNKRLRAEIKYRLVQVAAVCVAIIECMDREDAKEEG